LLRACFAEYGGHEMGTEGDSFFVVFQSAGAAVSCCVAAPCSGRAACSGRAGLARGRAGPGPDGPSLRRARAAIARHERDAEFGTGRALTQQQAVALLLTPD